MKERAWIQAAIDVEDIELAKQIAFMALDAGAEWLEVGTPLLYQYGHSAIGMLRKAVGENAILVADYKTNIAVLCAAQAAREGADYVLLSSDYNDWATEHSIIYCKQVGIQPIFDLAVHPEDTHAQAKKLKNMGVKYIYSRRYAQVIAPSGEKKLIDNISNIGVHDDVKLGVTSDNLEEAQDAVRCGADWITFGVILRKADPASCKKWIDTIHNARQAAV